GRMDAEKDVAAGSEDKEEEQHDTEELADEMEGEDALAEVEVDEKIGDVEEEQQEENNGDDDIISIASSDLSMADEACENSDEEEMEQSDEIVEDVAVQDFDPDSLQLIPPQHIRAPWFKHAVAECDAKNWEIFVEAIEAFDHESIFEGIDDFIVTVETLLPHLPSCFVTLVKDNVLSEKEAASKIMVWLEVCLSKEVQALNEAKKMHDIAFGILKAVCDSSKSSAIGKCVVESGVMELLLDVIEESEGSELRTRALLSIFHLISSPALWRISNDHFRCGDLDSQKRTLYSRLVALSLGHRFFIGKSFMHRLTLVLSWSRFDSALSRLESCSTDMLDAVHRASSVGDLPVAQLSQNWDELILSFNALRDYISEFDDEKVCAVFDVYGLLQSSSFLGICTRLLAMSRVADRFPNALHFIEFLLSDKYYGTLFIVHDVELVPLLAELKLLAQAESTNEDTTFENFEEGVCEMDQKFPSATEIRLKIVYRLHVLHLLDKLRSCAGTLRHNIDDETRLSALMSLCELCNDTNGGGQREILWALAQKYVYYIMDIIEYAAAHSSLRSSSSFILSLHLLALVVAEVDDPHFWLRNARPFSRLVSAKGGITSSMHKKLNDYLSPFTEPLLHNLGAAGSDVTSCLIKQMKTAFERRNEITPVLGTSVRVLETVMVNASKSSLLELFHTMEQDGSLDSLAQWLFGLAQNRHAMWQMGEPASSAASKSFHVFAFPVLRIFASYMKTCNNLDGSSAKFRTLNEVMMDALFLMWSSAGGMNGQRFTPECRKIRLAVLDVLTPALLHEKSLAEVIRHILSRSCSRPHLYAAALSLLICLAPWAPPLVIAKTELPSWKDVVVGHRQRVNRFVRAFSSCESRSDFAEVLLSSSPYISELALKFVDRMSRLDRRLARLLAENLMNYIIASFNLRHTAVKKKENSVTTPTGSVNGDSLVENEENRPASTRMVRLLESLVYLCKAERFRVVLYEFLSHYPSRARLLFPILVQFEKPTFESERQSRFQNAVLDLISDLYCPSLWSSEFDVEFSDCEECPLADSNESSALTGLPVESLKKEEEQGKVSRPASVEIIEDDTDDLVTALELVEETDNDRHATSTLEAIVSSLCVFVNSPDQKIAAVRRALEILSKATSAALEEQNGPFIQVIRECIRRVGVRPLLDRMDKLFGSADVTACLLTLASTLDSLFGEQVEILRKVLDYSSSEHPLASIIIKIDEMKEQDASSKCLVKILDKFFESLSDCAVQDEAAKDEKDVMKIPVMYGRSAAVAKLYRCPIVELVEGTREVYKRIKAASSVLVKRQKTVGTRMGTEVSKIIDANKGKEKAVLKLLRRELEVREPLASRSRSRKRPPPATAESRDVKHKRI
uniref:HECT domain-containing protein n=1 Tax=Haemonchus contortus TaxID=6289 RepID=A0A7I4XVS0_HAECO